MNKLQIRITPELRVSKEKDNYPDFEQGDVLIRESGRAVFTFDLEREIDLRDLLEKCKTYYETNVGSSADSKFIINSYTPQRDFEKLKSSFQGDFSCEFIDRGIVQFDLNPKHSINNSL